MQSEAVHQTAVTTKIRRSGVVGRPPQKLSVAELAATMADVLDGVGHGERFVIERDGKPLATLGPRSATPGVTLREIIERVGVLKMPGDGFADDIESARAALLPATPPAWPD